MNKLKNLALMASLEMARLANGLDVPIHKPRMDARTYGTNPKRCKSCASFVWCNKHSGIRPMDNACREYKHKNK